MRLRLREVTMKRGLEPSSVCSALPITRRVRFQLSIVQYRKSRNTRADCLEAAVARQAKHVVDAVGLAPSHQLVVAETAVGAQDDAYAWPFLADLRDNARDRLDCAVTARDVRAPLAG